MFLCMRGKVDLLLSANPVEQFSSLKMHLTVPLHHDFTPAQPELIIVSKGELVQIEPCNVGLRLARDC